MNRPHRFSPLNAYLAFVAFSLSCMLFGPIGFVDVALPQLLLFLISFLGLFSLGYFKGTQGWAESSQSPSRSQLEGIASQLLTILLFWAVLSSGYAWVSALRSGAATSLTSLGDAYVEAYRGYVRGTATIDLAYVLNFIDEAAITLTVVLGISALPKASRPRRLAIIAVVTTYVAVNLLFTGKQKFLGDVVLFSLFGILLSMARHATRVSLRRLLALGAGALVLGALFTEILRQRYAATGIDIANVADKVHPLMRFNETSPVVELLGPAYGMAAGFFLFYFSNGMYGLSLALQLPFEWSYLIGNSYSLGRIAEILADKPTFVLARTYPFRVGEEFGWGFDKWHSAFAWVASDISFPGLVAVAPILGWIYGKVWRDAVKDHNPFASPLFLYLSLGLMFSLANNQMMHTLAGVSTLTVLLFGYVAAGMLDAGRQ